MSRPHVSKPRLRPLIRLCGVLVLCALAGGLVVVFRRNSPTPPEDSPPPAPADPRPAFATPFRNTRPEVAYVRDAVCAECHPEQAQTYANHPMARSVAPLASVAARQRYDTSAHNPF